MLLDSNRVAEVSSDRRLAVFGRCAARRGHFKWKVVVEDMPPRHRVSPVYIGFCDASRSTGDMSRLQSFISIVSSGSLLRGTTTVSAVPALEVGNVLFFDLNLDSGDCEIFLNGWRVAALDSVFGPVVPVVVAATGRFRFRPV
jgi:hypothetical protein